MGDVVTVLLPEMTLDNWKWECLRILGKKDPEAVLTIMKDAGCSNTMELPADYTVEKTLQLLSSWPETQDETQ